MIKGKLSSSREDDLDILGPVLGLANRFFVVRRERLLAGLSGNFPDFNSAKVPLFS